MSQKRGRGGKRPGAGRPPGSTNTLELGEVRAIKAARLRVPDDTPEQHAELADEALQTLVSVMRGEMSHTLAGPALKAATRIREEVCGPLAQKMVHAGEEGAPPVSISINWKGKE